AESLFAVRPFDPPVDQALGDAAIAALNDSRKPVQLAAVRALGRLRYPRALQAPSHLAPFYHKRDPAAGSPHAIARIANPSSRPLFLNALGAPSPALRRAGIEGLVRLGDRSASDEIQRALSGERDESVLSAARFSFVMLLGGSVEAIVRDLT